MMLSEMSELEVMYYKVMQSADHMLKHYLEQITKGNNNE